MYKYNRIITIVMDSVGIGALDDAEKFGDIGVNTVGHIAEREGLNVPNLKRLGLAKLVKQLDDDIEVEGSYSKMAELGDGKDTLTGHWEMMGCTVEKGFKQYIEKGFPKELIDEFEARTNRRVIANKEASGMKVIKEFYEEHMSTGALIVYTSVDSTFQIAAHEEVVPLKELYEACEIARELTDNDKYNIARVIARPFLGDKDNFYRTANRHDYAIKPNKKLVLEKLLDKKLDSIAVGKINDIFTGVGITEKVKTLDNMDGVDKTIEFIKRDNITGHIFTNLVDFDMKYGHPRDVKGYKQALEEFDARIPEIISFLKADDLLIITADHGNDPTYKGNDHTREYVPLLAYSHNISRNNFQTRKTFEDLGETICDNFKLESTLNGQSFLDEL